MKRTSNYLWQHGIDLAQDAVIEAAMVDFKKKTGATIGKYAMAKMIIMQYAEEKLATNSSYFYKKNQ